MGGYWRGAETRKKEIALGEIVSGTWTLDPGSAEGT